MSLNSFKKIDKKGLITSIGLILSLNGCGGEGGTNSNGIENPKDTIIPQTTTIKGFVQAGFVAGAEVNILTLDGKNIYTTTTDENGNYEIIVKDLEQNMSNYGLDYKTQIQIKTTGGVDIDPEDDGDINNDIDKIINGEMSLLVDLESIDKSRVTPISTLVSDILLGKNNENLELFLDENGKINRYIVKERINKILSDIGIGDVNKDGEVNDKDLLYYDMVLNETQIESDIRIKGFLDSIHEGNDDKKNSFINSKKSEINIVKLTNLYNLDNVYINFLKSTLDSKVYYSLDNITFFEFQNELIINQSESKSIFYKEIFINGVESKVKEYIFDFQKTPDTGTPDTGTPDTGTPDTGTPDTGTPDTGTPDTGTPDTGTPDTGTPDTGTPDTGTPDTGTPDTGTPDTGTPDTGTPDTGTPDTGTPDTGTPDTGTPDTGTPDTGTPDTGTPDTGTPDTGNTNDVNDTQTPVLVEEEISFDSQVLTSTQLENKGLGVLLLSGVTNGNNNGNNNVDNSAQIKDLENQLQNLKNIQYGYDSYQTQFKKIDDQIKTKTQEVNNNNYKYNETSRKLNQYLNDYNQWKSNVKNNISDIESQISYLNQNPIRKSNFSLDKTSKSGYGKNYQTQASKQNYNGGEYQSFVRYNTEGKGYDYPAVLIIVYDFGEGYSQSRFETSVISGDHKDAIKNYFQSGIKLKIDLNYYKKQLDNNSWYNYSKLLEYQRLSEVHLNNYNNAKNELTQLEDKKSSLWNLYQSSGYKNVSNEIFILESKISELKKTNNTGNSGNETTNYSQITKSFEGYFNNGTYKNYVTYKIINGVEHPAKVYGEYFKGGKFFRTKVYEIDSNLTLEEKNKKRDSFKELTKYGLKNIGEFSGVLDFYITTKNEGNKYSLSYNSFVHYDILNKGEDYPARVWLKYNFGGEEYILESKVYAETSREKDQLKEELKQELLEKFKNPIESEEGINGGKTFWNISTQSYNKMIGGAYKIYEVDGGYIGVYKVANNGKWHTSTLKSNKVNLSAEIKEIINNWYERNKTEPKVEEKVENREDVGSVKGEKNYTSEDFEKDLKEYKKELSLNNYTKSVEIMSKINQGLLTGNVQFSLEFLKEFKEGSEEFGKGFATGAYKAGKDTIVGIIETPEDIEKIANTTIEESKKSFNDAVTWIAFGGAYVNKIYQKKFGSEQDKQIADELINQFSNDIESRGEEVLKELEELEKGLRNTYELLKLGLSNLDKVENPEYYAGYLTGYVDTMIAEAVAMTYVTKKANIALTRLLNSKKYKDFVKMVALGKVGEEMELVYSKLNNLGNLKWDELEDLRDNVNDFIQTGSCGLKTASLKSVSYVNKKCNINFLEELNDFENIINLSKEDKNLLQNLLEKVKASNLDYDFIKGRLKNKDIIILKENINNIDEYIKSFEGGKLDNLKKIDIDGKTLALIYDNGKMRLPNGNSLKSKEINYILLKDGANYRLVFGENHSYLSMGKNIEYAGSIKFTNSGNIKYLDNGSGHYKPAFNDTDGKTKVLNTFKERFGIEIDINLFQPYNFIN